PRRQGLQSLGKNPRANVRASTGAEGNNKFHRPVRPPCRTPCKWCSQRDCTGQTGQDECPTGFDHGAPLGEVHCSGHKNVPTMSAFGGKADINRRCPNPLWCVWGGGPRCLRGRFLSFGSVTYRGF